MHGVFACPECGSEVEPADLTPGRQVRCADCGTLVEVPFFPRAQSIRRYRTGSKARRRLWMLAGGTSLTLGLLTGLILVRWAGQRAEHRREVRAAIAEADRSAASGNRAQAFNSLDTALQLATMWNVEPPGGLQALQKKRDEASRAEVAERIDQLSNTKSNVDQSIGELLTLWQRTRVDPALAGFAAPVEKLGRSIRDRWLATHLLDGRRLLDDGHAHDALALAERLHRASRQMPPDLDAEIQPALQQFVAEIVARAGAVVEPVHLSSTWEAPPNPPHDAEYRKRFEDAMRARGYLLRPPSSPFRALWDAAPYRLSLDVREGPGVGYLQSPHRVTQIEAVLKLDRPGQAPWLAAVQARTRVPVQGLGALQASRLGLGNRPNPEVEHRLYADARADLSNKINRKLPDLPPLPTQAPAVPD